MKFKIIFVLPVRSGSGGAHSVVQECLELFRSGVDIQIAVNQENYNSFLRIYQNEIPEIDQLIIAYFNEDHLKKLARSASVVCATIFKSVKIVAEIVKVHPNILPAYYIQDYEPLFFETHTPEWEEAIESYTLIPNAVLFAKTQWLCDVVRRSHNVTVNKVEPSIDHQVYYPNLQPNRNLIEIAAMVRFSTKRRAPLRTLRIAHLLSNLFPNQVRFSIFGTTVEEIESQGFSVPDSATVLGQLSRSEVASVLRKSDIFLDLSDYQAFGRTALEAMASGCISVVPQRGGTNEFAIPYVNSLVIDTTSEQECIMNISELIQADAHVLTHMKLNGIETAARYSTKRAAFSILNLFYQKLTPQYNYFQTAKSKTQTTITVVIPVYNAYEETKACIKSLLKNTEFPHQVLLIDDCSTDERIWPLLTSYVDAHEHIKGIRNMKNMGWTATMNKAFILTTGDLILLNSDTQVTPRWLEKIIRTARSQENIATVTPLSNAAGAFSIPENNTVNSLPEYISIEEMSNLVEKLSSNLSPKVPTGNGFCMYVSRQVLDTVGLFDVEHFPRGYGAENDFCMRSSAAGFIHLIDDSTFIYHQRSASFKEEKNSLIEDSKATLKTFYPHYKKSITDWLEHDPLEPLRQSLKQALQEIKPPILPEVQPQDERPVLLYIHHDGQGGIINNNQDLMDVVSQNYRCLMLKTNLQQWRLFEYKENSLKFLKQFEFEDEWRIEHSLKTEQESILDDILSEFKVVLVHIRNLLANAPEIIPAIKKRGLPVIFSFHDFYTVCPTIHLIDNRRNYCAGHCSPGKGTCRVPRTWIKEIPTLKHEYVYTWRERVAEALRHCDAFITTSKSAYNVIVDHFPFLKNAQFSIIEHGRDLQQYKFSSVPPNDKPVKVVFFGALGISKGITIVERIMQINAERGRIFEFHLIGDKPWTFKPAQYGGVYHGPYEREELPSLLSKIAPSFSIVPSIWPETYCHTLTESWAAGIPAFASNLGTLKERIQNHGGGWLLDYKNPQAWYDGMVKVLDTPGEYEQRLAEVKSLELPTVQDMATQYYNIYVNLLAMQQQASMV